MKKLSIYILTIAIATVFIASCTTEDDPIIPVACMQVSAHNVFINEVVNFSNCSTNANEVLWNMGDGPNTFTYSSVDYAYSDTGTYVVTLVATTDSISDTITDTIHVHN